MGKAAKKTAPFIVIDKGLRILITPSEGWYAVQGLDIRGLNTQGRTIEEAIYMAHDAADALAESRAKMAEETARKVRAESKSHVPGPKPTARRCQRARTNQA